MCNLVRKMTKGLAVLSTAVLATSAFADDIPERTLSLSTSGKGGSWFAVGSRVIQEVNKAHPDLATQVQTGGGLTNLRKIQAGQADVGITFAFAAPLAYEGIAPFEEAHGNLTYLGALFPGYLQIVTTKEAEINSFEDLFDKRISSGKIGWGGELMFRLMLDAYDTDYDGIRANGGVINHVGTGEAAQMMRDGTLDAIISGGSPPSHPTFKELSLTNDIDLVDVGPEGLAKIFEANPTFVKSTMPADPYKGVSGNFETIGGSIILVASKDLSEEAAYEIVKALYDNLDDIKGDLSQLTEAKREDALSGNKGLPVHPGAARYYKEIGLM